MNTDELFELYLLLQDYVGWTDVDMSRVPTLLEQLEPHFEELIEDFYQQIQQTPRALQVITGGEEQIERLKQTLLVWIRNLFCGEYDHKFVSRRWEVGLRHVEIKLDQAYASAAIARLRIGMLNCLCEHFAGSKEELAGLVITLNRLLDLDTAIIESAYRSAFDKLARMNERYATIGRVSGGIAHELRNPLNVVQTSVYYLLNAKNPTSEKVQAHLHRIERQVSRCDGIITTLTDFAKLPEPNLEPFELDEILEDTVSENTCRPGINVELNLAPDAKALKGEPKQLKIAFGNLIRNACEAMTSGGTLEISSRHKGRFVEISFRDEGCGIPPEKIHEITQPLFTTKSFGIGLGLAVTTAILERHRATMHIKSEVDKGSTFTIRFPEV